MLKEYIDKMIQENQDELNKYEIQMQELFGDLKAAQEWVEQLNREKSLDTNIFSPRNNDPEADEKIEESTKNIRQINLQIEYTRELIETHTKKKIEYEQLKVETEKTDAAKPKTTENEERKLETFLNELFRKTELCLALVNGDRNKCKAELRSMKNMIKEFTRGKNA